VPRTAASGHLVRASIINGRTPRDVRDHVARLYAAVQHLTSQLPACKPDSPTTWHARQLFTADLTRIQDARSADREASRARDEDNAAASAGWSACWKTRSAASTTTANCKPA
jgi:hypothetical protein